QAQAKTNWAAMQEPANQLANALSRLTAGPALYSLTRGNDAGTLNELRSQVNTAQESARAAQHAIKDQDAARLQGEMAKFRKCLEAVREATKRPPRGLPAKP